LAPGEQNFYSIHTTINSIAQPYEPYPYADQFKTAEPPVRRQHQRKKARSELPNMLPPPTFMPGQSQKRQGNKAAKKRKLRPRDEEEEACLLPPSHRVTNSRPQQDEAPSKAHHHGLLPKRVIL